MNKLEDLLKKRNAEIAAQQERERLDKKNYNDSVWYGILGVVIGVIVGFIGYIALAIALAIFTGIHDLFAAHDLFQNKSNENSFYHTLLVICIILGIIIGYIYGFTDHRKRPK
jgi:ABC-type antimicrobial peptide transport system permease subunit